MQSSFEKELRKTSKYEKYRNQKKKKDLQLTPQQK